MWNRTECDQSGMHKERDKKWYFIHHASRMMTDDVTDYIITFLYGKGMLNIVQSIVVYVIISWCVLFCLSSWE